jgi:hypothetical protein
MREVQALHHVGAMELPANDTAHRTAHDTYFRRLMHRWLVEYNPLYLLSATLVLGGMILTSRGLAREGSLYGEIGVAAIAEVYAATLIGGAALLTRIGQRRPAVMLALLTMLYQCDLTLQTEASPYLGAVGTAATVAWLALFVASAGGVTSAVPLDAWGATVLRRAVRASWSLGAVLFVAHVMFWSTQHPIMLAALLPVASLLAARRLRSEGVTWLLVAATLVFAVVSMPSAFAVTALMATTTLVLRALLPSVPSAESPAAYGVAARDEAGPYRALVSGDRARWAPATAVPVFVPPTFDMVDRAERMRLLTGALFTLHLAVWTLGWTGGHWPAHVLVLDLATAVGVLLLAWRARVRVALVPLAAGAMHLVVRAHLVPPPRSLLEWGATAVGLGFALLLASLLASYRLRGTS